MKNINDLFEPRVLTDNEIYVLLERDDYADTGIWHCRGGTRSMKVVDSFLDKNGIPEKDKCYFSRKYQVVNMFDESALEVA